MPTATAFAKWQRTHSHAEQRLAVVLGRFFDQQRRRVVAGLRDFDHITTAVVPQIFRVDDELDAFTTAASDPIISFMVDGAADVLKRAKRPKSTKAFDASGLIDFDLPQRVRDSIRTVFESLAGQEYWRTIQGTTSRLLIDLIGKGIEDGLTRSRLVKSINEALGGASKVRSKAIARTESTLAYSSGHQSSYDELAAMGQTVNKQWLALLHRTRESHQTLHQVVVGHNENFDVGGSSAPYPGHWLLPADERVNCRCVTVANFPD